MSYAELLVVSPLMKEKEESWSERELAAVEALGSKVYPYLLDKLLDNDCAHRGRRYCDQANALLRRLSGRNLGEMERTALLELNPENPDRKFRLAVRRNHASMRLFQRRWTSALLGG